MGNFFNPGDVIYRRKVRAASIYACCFVAGQSIMMDYGKQEHVFTPIQKYVFKKIDNFFDVKPEELDRIIRLPPPSDSPTAPSSEGAVPGKS
eukprot:gene3393-3718_t